MQFSANLMTTAGAAVHPGGSEAIKLPAEQKTKLLGGAKSAVALTSEQKVAIEGMFGEPYKGRTSTSPFGGFALGRDSARRWFARHG